MILIKATLVAGPHHRKYASGTSMPALFFVARTSEDEAEALASSELQERGWATMTIERLKNIVDDSQFDNSDDVVAEAFRDAKETGFGVVVYPCT